MFARGGRISRVVKLDVHKKTFVYIAAQLQAGTSESDALIFPDGLVALLTAQVGIAFQHPIVAQLSIAA